MSIFNTKGLKELAEVKARLHAVTERSQLLDEACGVGLLEAVLHKGMLCIQKANGHGLLNSAG